MKEKRHTLISVSASSSIPLITAGIDNGMQRSQSQYQYGTDHCNARAMSGAFSHVWNLPTDPQYLAGARRENAGLGV